jgi:hypothetical protein
MNDQPAPFRINARACGDFAVQRFVAGRIVRWGVYPSREEAQKHLRAANQALRADRTLPRLS